MHNIVIILRVGKGNFGKCENILGGVGKGSDFRGLGGSAPSNRLLVIMNYLVVNST